MYDFDNNAGYDPFVAELFEFSARVATTPRQALRSQLTAAAIATKPAAEPLSPLRSRDITALNDLFTHDRLTEIEADIHHHLQRLIPEPCWEDRIFLEFAI